jgi:mono/diheme cytochrome c family protein
MKAVVLLCLLALVGCAGRTSRVPPIEIFPDMDRQGKYMPQRSSTVFADGRASRPPVPGTVARGLLKEDDAYTTGVANNMYVGRNPETMTRALLTRGQERFDIYCSPCHDRTGSGQGLVPKRALWLPANLHDERIKQMTDGELFNVISFGRRSMPGYRFQIPEKDRWAIVAYVRALQRATSGKVDDVPPELRSEVR